MRRVEIVRESLVAALLVALAVFLVDSGLDYFLQSIGTSRWWTLLISHTFTALAVGIFAAYSFFLHRQREAEVRARVDRIVEMNHHVRNALQVIAYWSLADRDRKDVELIRQAVDRIEWALREILPRGLGVITPFKRKPPVATLPPTSDRSSSTSA